MFCNQSLKWKFYDEDFARIQVTNGVLEVIPFEVRSLTAQG